ncbi:hypothetical protein RHSP_11363 [Rhizobium freirei PRF 81]|uniref:Uncharacterized protein n=1 Tax=Rhizobium freirei PRF 81 TaxID=363754 RepID=N6V4Q9_9HYPH|nr:hypothetical protein [Rhizobium freirei]ENN88865.1 hypothetical protein RHSP_11363 [Rhizobium freirei PRF 81]
MMDSIALAKAIELQNQAREEQWRKNEDLFYRDYGLDPPRPVVWIGRVIAGLSALRTAIKKADRPEVGRSACDDGDSCRQAASCRA